MNHEWPNSFLCKCNVGVVDSKNLPFQRVYKYCVTIKACNAYIAHFVVIDWVEQKKHVKFIIIIPIGSRVDKCLKSF